MHAYKNFSHSVYKVQDKIVFKKKQQFWQNISSLLLQDEMERGKLFILNIAKKKSLLSTYCIVK